ncbi:MAG TPA: type II secretion system protein GspM, partial [Steroidobacteraceae bacterium]|nr:type II secretion system protein GspM [Steroidobacteraceae bacterium]
TSTLTQNGAASVHFEQAAFDALATWANDVVQRDGLHIESATIESTSTPGIVNATIVLRRG